MTSEPTLGSRATSLSHRLRQLSIHLPGLGDRNQLHQQLQQQKQQKDEEPEFQITHTPDRPSRLVDPSEAPSEEDCRVEIAAWQRRAGEGALTLVGSMAHERRRTHRLRRMSKVDRDNGGVGGTDEGHVSEYEDVLVDEGGDNVDEGFGEEGDGRDPLPSHLTNLPHDAPPECLPAVNRPKTHDSYRLAVPVGKLDGHNGRGGVEPLRRSEASQPPVLDSNIGGIRAARGRLLQNLPSLRVSMGYSSDGDESYNGEVVEAEQVDVQRLYELEAARRGYCLLCKARTIAREAVVCTKCGTDFERAFGDDIVSCPAIEDQRLRHAEGPGSSSSRHRPRRRRSFRPVPSPLSGDAAYSNTRLAALGPLMQLYGSAPKVESDATRIIEDYILEEDISPIKAVFHPSPQQTNYFDTANHDVQHPSQEQLHVAMMQIFPTTEVRNTLVRRSRAPQGREILRTDKVTSSVPAVVEATMPSKQYPGRSRKPVSKFHRPMSATKGFEEERENEGWELDLVSLYEADSPPPIHRVWV